MSDAVIANQAKSAFTARMSHEMRTPLNAVIGFAVVMREDSQLSDESRGFANEIKKSGERLLRTVVDSLDLTAIDTGSATLREGYVAPRQRDRHGMACRFNLFSNETHSHLSFRRPILYLLRGWLCRGQSASGPLVQRC